MTIYITEDAFIQNQYDEGSIIRQSKLINNQFDERKPNWFNTGI